MSENGLIRDLVNGVEFDAIKVPEITKENAVQVMQEAYEAYVKLPTPEYRITNIQVKEMRNLALRLGQVETALMIEETYKWAFTDEIKK